MDLSSQLLHFSDPDCLEFDARVVEQTPLPDGRTAVVLDRTYFFPTGGGQEYDLGMLAAARVVDVYKDAERGLTVHVVDRPLPAGEVHAVIDADRRMRHRRHHTAQHLLSDCIVRLLGRVTVSSNINGDTPSTLDLDGPEPTRAELHAVETQANRRIWDNLAVKTYFVAPDKLDDVPLRKPPKVSVDIRIVEIDGLEYSACGGTHVTRTGAIGAIKIVRLEKVRERTRIHFIAGDRALELFQATFEIASGLAQELTVGMNELPDAVRRLLEQAKTAQRESNRLQSELLAMEAERLYAAAAPVGERRLALAFLGPRSMNDVRRLARALGAKPGCAALLAGEDGGRIALAAACSPESGLHAGDLIRRYIPRLNGRGGGDASLAQGSGPATAEDARRLLAQARADLMDGFE